MKFFHLSDLHLGKRLFEFSLLDDQSYILDRILEAAETEQPDAVIIAGDIYDKPIPPAEAVALFDSFLCRLSGLGTTVMVISGNHDSPERIAFGGRLMENSGVYVSPVYGGCTSPIYINDGFGEVCFYLLPFIKPVHVRRFYPDSNIESYTDAVRTAVEGMNVDPKKRNVLVTHQFITGASRSDSEEVSVGGTDNVDVSTVEGFDYVALGHIHSPQKIGTETVRYCGTPLKYSFSEVNHEKSVCVVELLEKGRTDVSFIPLTPLRDLREIRGSYGELTFRENYKDTNTDDYIHATLTDEDDIPDALSKLRAIYPNLMKLDYDNTRTRTQAIFSSPETSKKRSPIELFSELYEKQNGVPMDEVREGYIKKLIANIFDKEDTL